MSRRHQRMKYDPPGQRKRRRRDNRHLRLDQIELNRRTLLMKGGILTAFTAMTAKLGVMQLVQGDRYKKRAENNVISTVTIPAARGLIVDAKGRRLAQNRRSWELRVTPSQLPNEETEPAERQRVLNTLINALQIEDTLVAQKAAMGKGDENTVFSRVATMLGYSGDDARNLVEYWTNQVTKEIYLNLLPNGGLSPDDAARFRAAFNELPGIKVMNRLEWLIENTWSARLPIIVAQDIPREVALKLEANRMYLPGVELDDQALVREYLGGEVMSHVIGYVSPISAAMVDDPRWMGPHGERVYELNDVIGQTGIELAMERDLRGKRGRENVERDAAGVEMRVMPQSRVDPVDGSNVWLTIDLELQNAVGAAVQDAVEKAAAAKETANQKRQEDGKELLWKIPTSGAAVVYDPRNGDIHAMVSYPYYDNQLFIQGISQRKWGEYTQDDGPKAFLNRCTDEAYPPGSTFKVFLAASALDRGSLDTQQTHDCTGAIRVPNTFDYLISQPFACWRGWIGSEHGEMDVYGAIEQSCDVFFYAISEEYSQTPGAPDPTFYWDSNLLSGDIVSDQKHVFNGEGIMPIHEDMTTKFVFGRPTGIEINEVAGLMPSPDWKLEQTGEGWSTADTLNISIGQGDFRATPLQMALNTGIIAANGEVRNPRLVLKQTADLPRVASTPESAASPSASPVVTSVPAGTVEKTEPDARLDMAQSALDIVKEGMIRVITGENGTARANGDGTSKWLKTNPEGEAPIAIAGKTGTAEFGVAEPTDGSRDTHAWFTAYAPAQEPEIAIAVIIEAGGEGSTFAVPVADTIMRAWFELTGIRPRGVVLSKDPMPV